jgi:hypothetical protein
LQGAKSGEYGVIGQKITKQAMTCELARYCGAITKHVMPADYEIHQT